MHRDDPFVRARPRPRLDVVLCLLPGCGAAFAFQVRVFYKFGFKVKGTKNFGSTLGGFPLFCMVRDPKPVIAAN